MSEKALPGVYQNYVGLIQNTWLVQSFRCNELNRKLEVRCNVFVVFHCFSFVS